MMNLAAMPHLITPGYRVHRVPRAAGGGLAGAMMAPPQQTQGGPMQPQPGQPGPMQQQRPVIAQRSGLFPGVGSGRADTMKATVPAGTYIIPADVVSAIGDGNTLAGAKVLDKYFGQDPTAQAQTASPPPPAQPSPGLGGRAAAGPPVPIQASGGEYRVLPSTVAKIGSGDIDHGHDILDHFCTGIRAAYAKKIKKLPKPKR